MQPLDSFVPWAGLGVAKWGRQTVEIATRHCTCEWCTSIGRTTVGCFQSFPAGAKMLSLFPKQFFPNGSYTTPVTGLVQNGSTWVLCCYITKCNTVCGPVDLNHLPLIGKLPVRGWVMSPMGPCTKHLIPTYSMNCLTLLPEMYAASGESICSINNVKAVVVVYNWRQSPGHEVWLNGQLVRTNKLP